MWNAQGLLLMRFSAVFCLLVSLLGCIPVSQHPVTPHDATLMDTRLYGVWYWAEDNEYGHVHIGIDSDSGLLRLEMIDHRDDGRMSLSEYQGHSSQAGAHHYLNLREVKDCDVNADYLIVKYVIDAQGLGIALMEDDILRKDIEQGSLAGTNDKSSARITADSKTLQRYLQQKDSALFPRTAYLKRLPRPEPTVAVQTNARAQ